MTACYLNVEDTQLGKPFILKWNRKEEFIDNYRDMLLSLPSYHDLKDEKQPSRVVSGDGMAEQ